MKLRSVVREEIVKRMIAEIRLLATITITNKESKKAKGILSKR